MLCCQPMTMGLKMWPRNAGCGWDEGDQGIVLWNIMLIVGREDLVVNTREERLELWNKVREKSTGTFPWAHVFPQSQQQWMSEVAELAASLSELAASQFFSLLLWGMEFLKPWLYVKMSSKLDLAKYIRLKCVFPPLNDLTLMIISF